MKTLVCVMVLMCCVFKTKAQTWEIVKADTINKADGHNQKQGKWVIYGRHNIENTEKCFTPYQKVKEGFYLNNRKTGVWVEYYCNQNFRNKLTYVNGTLEGAATFYDKNGVILKEGFFKANKWVKN